MLIINYCRENRVVCARPGARARASLFNYITDKIIERCSTASAPIPSRLCVPRIVNIGGMFLSAALFLSLSGTAARDHLHDAGEGKLPETARRVQWRGLLITIIG